MKVLSLDYVLHITGFQQAPTSKGKRNTGANASWLQSFPLFDMLNDLLTAWGLQLHELLSAYECDTERRKISWAILIKADLGCSSLAFDSGFKLQ